MTAAIQTLIKLHDLGVIVHIAPCGEKIRLDAPAGAISDDLLAEVKVRKALILKALLHVFWTRCVQRRPSGTRDGDSKR